MNRYRVGITDHAQAQLGEIVHIEFAEVDKDYSIGDSVATI